MKNKNKPDVSDAKDYISSRIEEMFHFLVTLGENDKLWSAVARGVQSFFRFLFWLITLLAIIILAINVIHFVPNNRYIEMWNVIPIFSNLNLTEYRLVMAGIASSFYAAVLILVMVFRFVNWIIRGIVMFINKIKQSLINSVKSITTAVTSSKLWRFLYNTGMKIGFNYFLYPALPYLEPELDRTTLHIDSLNQLPPEAFDNKEFCEITTRRYGNASILGLLVFMIFFILLIIIWAVITQPIYFLSALISPKLEYILQQTLPIFLLPILMIFVFSFLKPYRTRYDTWIKCSVQHDMVNILENEVRDIKTQATVQLRQGIERLKNVYNNESQRTQEAKQQRILAINQLRHIADDSNIDSQTKNSLAWLVEFALDKRKQEEIVEEKNKFQRDIAINIGVAFVFYILGKF